MPRKNRTLSSVGVVVIVAATIVIGGLATREYWQSTLMHSSAEGHDESDAMPLAEPTVLKLSRQARANLGLVAKPVTYGDYWRTIQVPGVIVDRPGQSDRGVTSPAVGVVSKIHAFTGDTVRPGEKLFTLRLLSEYLQNAQSELFKATRETELIQEERTRLESLATTGSIAGNRIIELNQQIRRQAGFIQAYRQDLLTRGLSPAQIDQIAAGNFVSTIDVVAPPPLEADATPGESRQVAVIENSAGDGVIYEVQELKIELGQQVLAGQLLSVLANHQRLFIEGHAFKREAPFLEQAARAGWPIEVEFTEDDAHHWPTFEQTYEIRHLANTIDTDSRTFDFYIPLTNQSRMYDKQGESFIVWRFRPGQRVRLRVPVERLENVLVLPAEAIVREGPEAYVFRQNGDLFDRFPVRVLLQDRTHVVVARDSTIPPGIYLAQGSAASLNRVLKAQAASGVPAGFHVHADGTVHGSH